MSSFPVPVSPSMRTVESVDATCFTCSRTDSRAALLPMIRSNLRSVRSPSRYVTETELIEDSSGSRSEEHTSELQSHSDIVCRLLLEKKKYHLTRYRVRHVAT